MRSPRKREELPNEPLAILPRYTQGSGAAQRGDPRKGVEVVENSDLSGEEDQTSRGQERRRRKRPCLLAAAQGPFDEIVLPIRSGLQPELPGWSSVPGERRRVLVARGTDAAPACRAHDRQDHAGKRPGERKPRRKVFVHAVRAPEGVRVPARVLLPAEKNGEDLAVRRRKPGDSLRGDLLSLESGPLAAGFPLPLGHFEDEASALQSRRQIHDIRDLALGWPGLAEVSRGRPPDSGNLILPIRGGPRAGGVAALHGDLVLDLVEVHLVGLGFIRGQKRRPDVLAPFEVLVEIRTRAPGGELSRAGVELDGVEPTAGDGGFDVFRPGFREVHRTGLEVLVASLADRGRDRREVSGAPLLPGSGLGSHPHEALILKRGS